MAPPIIADGILYIGAEETLNAIDVNDGKVLWAFEPKDADDMEASPTINNGVIYCPFGGTLYALE